MTRYFISVLVLSSSIYAGLDSLPSVIKYRSFFVPLLKQNMHPIWYPNSQPLTREQYAGNIYSDKLLEALNGQSADSKLSALSVLDHLVIVAKYNRKKGRPLVRDSAMYFVIRDAIQSDNPKLRKRGIEIFVKEVHPDLLNNKLSDVKRILGLTDKMIEKSVMLKIPLTKSEQEKVIVHPENFSFKARLYANEKNAIQNLIAKFDSANTYKKIKSILPNLIKIDRKVSAPLIFARINDSIYVKEGASSKKHVRNLIIDALGSLYPDNKLLNDEYRLYIQYGKTYRTKLQKKHIEASELEQYLTRVMQWGKKALGINPKRPLESRPIIIESNELGYVIPNPSSKTYRITNLDSVLQERKRKSNIDKINSGKPLKTTK